MNHSSPYFTWSDPGDGNGSGVSYYRGFIDDVDQGNVSTGWHPTLGEETHTVYIKAVDGVGLSNNSQLLTFKIDLTPPSVTINSLSPNPFNQMYQQSTMGVTINDNYSSQVNYGVRIYKMDLTRVRTIRFWDSGYIAAGSISTTWDGKNDSGDYVNEGDYYFAVAASDEAGNQSVTYATWAYARDDVLIAGGAWTGALPYSGLPELSNNGTQLMISWVIQQINPMAYIRYQRSSSDLGQSWGQFNGPYVGPPPSVGPTSIGDHSVKAENNQIWYRRANSAWIQLTNISGIKEYPSLAVDANNNAYVAWRDWRNGGNAPAVYFQKIPVDFAPINGTVSMAIRHTVVSESAALESPTLVAPKNIGDAAYKNVQSIRPTFEWKHHKGDATEYKLEIDKEDTFNTVAHQTFNKSANTGSPDKTDATLYYFNYAIHEFDPGLDRDTYYWKVTALSTNEAATSEVWSFTISPELSLSGITNYPNPFNPNRERTKIRYRLSTDASEVKIRIYDITGSLVTELDGTTAGEASSVWSKYNDVEWDGRNGRGDIVMNGIYPFEVTARLGDRSVSGRGKIAVLK